MNGMWRKLMVAAAFSLAAVSASAAEVTVAVAANFTSTMKTLAAKFEAKTGNKVVVSFGSTGKLYTQIVNGAPYDVFLSADTARPQLLEQNGKAVVGSRFTYALGRLVLWSAKPGVVDTEGTILNDGDFEHIAIANPKTAPYGAAAMEVMNGLGVYDTIKSRIVEGDNIAQTYQFVATGNALIGFVALSEVEAKKTGSWWEVPQGYYTPIRQDAILLKRAAHNAAAKRFMAFLRSGAAQAIIAGSGYGVAQ